MHDTQAAVLAELTSLAAEDPTNCKFVQVTYRDGPKGKDVVVPLTVEGGEVVTKGSSQKWVQPVTGTVTAHFSFSTTIPTLEMAASSDTMAVRARSWM